VWLEKQAVGRHDDSCDVRSAATAAATTTAAAGSEDEPASYAHTSPVDTGSITTIRNTYSTVYTCVSGDHFLPRDARRAKRGIAIISCPSVDLSICL